MPNMMAWVPQIGADTVKEPACFVGAALAVHVAERCLRVPEPHTTQRHWITPEQCKVVDCLLDLYQELSNADESARPSFCRQDGY